MNRRKFVLSSAVGSLALGAGWPAGDVRAAPRRQAATRKILIAGGGYGTAFIRYMAQLTGKPRPKLCYLPTASADRTDGIVTWFRNCAPLNVEPYVQEKVSWAIRYHQALRFYPDPAHGYEYPELYTRIFGKDYEPQPHIKAAYDYARNHKWYFEARMVTVNDLYAFDPNAKVSIEPFIDIIGRQFKQPKEGLGNDGSPTAHMWRTMMFPDNPL